jgi:hypothetical protein
MSKIIPYSAREAARKGSKFTETALGLVYDFLNEPRLRKLSDQAIGGTFPVRHFKLNPKCYAKQFWFCHDKGHRDSVFLAMEDSWRGWPRNMTEREIPRVPEASELVRPSASIIFDDKKYDRRNISEVSAFILDQKDSNKPVKKVSKDEVIQYSRNFVRAFGGKEKRYCKYPLGYFENYELETERLYIKEFMEQGPIQYVRYFFGLDKTYTTNRIRIVLFPIQSDRTVLRVSKGEVSGMLEASWPPPPPVTTS